MSRRWPIAFMLVPLTLALASGPGSAGPEKIAFPASDKDHVLYATSIATTTSSTASCTVPPRP